MKALFLHSNAKIISRADCSGCLVHERAECYKILNSSGVRKLRSNAQQQPNSIESKPLITYNLNEMPQALRLLALY
ncbi:hypothetical protein [Microcoleus sp. D2_18a_D3]|uniref:hypothetical protein n=1 Tax=Microcoleus sp. D2_18a_D3 TaxID=3055330 RepID=UPI002FD2CF20